MEFLQYFIDVLISGILFLPLGLLEAVEALTGNTYTFLAWFVNLGTIILLMVVIVVVLIDVSSDKNIKNFLKRIVWTIIGYFSVNILLSLPVLLYEYNNYYQNSQFTIFTVVVLYVTVAGVVLAVHGERKSDFRTYTTHNCKVLMIMYSPARVEDDSYTTFINTGSGVNVPIHHDSSTYHEAHIRLLLQPLKDGLWAYEDATIGIELYRLKELQEGSVIDITTISNDTYENESFVITDYEVIK
ncbi:hypothetical protein [Breznakia pachnodae]|uniref:Membrane protein n=1 Tax=Breznakia pachnodae TaxID=265178 RepID=A0ABU0E725_9FIRM|nr:hypothetical protein [Breznakia pachnodae]MDQ0362509.1 putative membrane protein [Breznakia pachnodae]